MKFHNIAGPLTMMSSFGFAYAQCVLSNGIGDQAGTLETRSALCTVQANGNLQFALDVTESSVPTFDGGNPLAGISGNTAFILYNSICEILGTFDPGDQGNDCGTPYEIDVGLGTPIDITSVDFDVAAPAFEFDFGGMHYDTAHSECGGCGDLSSGLTAEQGCKCGFWVGISTDGSGDDEP